MWWACWFKCCFGRAHDEGMLACTCQKIVFAGPNDFMILVLMVRGVSASLPRSLPTLVVWRSLALVQFVASREDRCPGLFHISWPLSISDKKSITRLVQVEQKVQFLNTELEMRWRKGKGKQKLRLHLLLYSGVLLWDSLGTGEGCSCELCGAETSHLPSPTTT